MGTDERPSRWPARGSVRMRTASERPRNQPCLLAPGPPRRLGYHTDHVLIPSHIVRLLFGFQSLQRLPPSLIAMSLLANKVVCITGSSRGIGRACAVEAARHGATGLVLHYFGDDATTKEAAALKEEIESTFPGAKAVTVPGDIAEAATAKKVSPCGVHTTCGYQ